MAAKMAAMQAPLPSTASTYQRCLAIPALFLGRSEEPMYSCGFSGCAVYNHTLALRRGS